MLLLYRIKYRKIIIVGLLIALVFTISGCKNSEEGLVAKVDGEGITIEEFESEYEVYKRMYEQQLGEDAMSQTGEGGKTLGEELKGNIVEKLIMERLVAKDAKNMNIVVTDEEIKEQMDQYIAIVEEQEKFDEFLEANKLTKEFLKENLKKDLLFNKHNEAFLKDVKITDEEIENYFNSNKEDLVVVKASHILVKSEEDGKKVIDKLNAGEAFASVAATESIDSSSAVQGGNLGYFKKGTYVNEFEQAAFALKVGETSKLVKTEVGYHVIKIEDRKDTLETLKDDIILVLKDDKYLEKIQSLRDSAKVKIFLDTKTK